MRLGFVMVLPVCVTPNRNFCAGFTQMQPLTIDIQVPGIIFNDPAFDPADITDRSWRGGQIPLDCHDLSGSIRGLLGLPESRLSMLAFHESMFYSSFWRWIGKINHTIEGNCSSRLPILDYIFFNAEGKFMNGWQFL